MVDIPKAVHIVYTQLNEFGDKYIVLQSSPKSMP